MSESACSSQSAVALLVDESLFVAFLAHILRACRAAHRLLEGPCYLVAYRIVMVK